MGRFHSSIRNKEHVSTQLTSVLRYKLIYSASIAQLLKLTSKLNSETAQGWNVLLCFNFDFSLDHLLKVD